MTLLHARLVWPGLSGHRRVFQAMVECGARMTYIDVQEPYLWSYASLMPCLEHFTSLKQLNVTNPSEAFLCALSHCPRLQFLWVDRLQGNEGQWAALRGFPGLRYLYIGLMLQAPGALGLGGDNGQQANVCACVCVGVGVVVTRRPATRAVWFAAGPFCV